MLELVRIHMVSEMVYILPEKEQAFYSQNSQVPKLIAIEMTFDHSKFINIRKHSLLYFHPMLGLNSSSTEFRSRNLPTCAW